MSINLVNPLHEFIRHYRLHLFGGRVHSPDRIKFGRGVILFPALSFTTFKGLWDLYGNILANEPHVSCQTVLYIVIALPATFVIRHSDHMVRFSVTRALSNQTINMWSSEEIGYC